ncbi:MAG: LEA type 2 family protein [Thermoanaerobaculum sp.]
MTGLLLLFALGSPTPTPVPPAKIVKLTAELPDRSYALVTLQAQGKVQKLKDLAGHKLYVASNPVALPDPPDVSLTGDGFLARFKLPYASVPEAVLSHDPHALALRWEALDPLGKPVLVAEGAVDLGDPGHVSFSPKRAYELFARLDRLQLSPGLAQVGFSALLSLYNPLSFELVVQRIEYEINVGGTTLFSGNRPGMRLRPGRANDVLLEQEVPLASLGGAVQSLLNDPSLEFSGKIFLRTPAGVQVIPLQFGNR